MVWTLSLSRVRVAAVAVLAAALSACASSPVGAPIVNGRAAPGSYAGDRGQLRPPAPPINLQGWPEGMQRAPEIISNLPPSQCVPYARNISGVEIFGDAVTWWRQAEGRYPRSRTPAQGSVMVLRGWQDETRGHVAVVTTLLSARVVLVDHANWMRHGEVSIGVPVIDVSEANDWSQVRVWHVPGAHWGGRTYDAEGFIHPIGLDGSAKIASR